ncbi:MAG: P-loop NTPase fold protein [Pseudomonadota bacterium]
MKMQTDHAITDMSEDRLDRANLAGTLFDVLHGPELQTPITVGIYGGWGSGKTSVMNMLRKRLDEDRAGVTLWFNAWKYASSDETLWRALLLEIVTALGNSGTGIPALPAKGNTEKDAETLDKRLADLKSSLYRSRSWTEQGAVTVNWNQAVPFAMDMVLRAVGFTASQGLFNLFRWRAEDDTAKEKKRDEIKEMASQTMELFEREEIERFQAHVTSLEQFEDALKSLIKDEIAARNMRLYVFVDDLDRCMPDQAVSALEAIKLFMDQKDCVFILGMDRDAVEEGIRQRYPFVPDESGKQRQQIEPRKYLDKIIQLPFNLAPLSGAQVRGFVESLLIDTKFEADLADSVVKACPPNPRTLKRVLNVLTLQRRLLPHLDDRDFRLLTKLVLLQTLYDKVFEMISGDPQDLLEFENAITDLDDAGLLSMTPEQRQQQPTQDLLDDQGRLWDEAFALGADDKLVALLLDGPYLREATESLEQLLSQTQATSDRSFESLDANIKKRRVRRKK